ncbi:MAG TPA: NAD(P)/FAD-dependent oxidoreductase [Rubricoccaceae bacterium]|nr:NAD(P)/FAD-dependent oxidoreductase [Rubricoccaceae bacterium]
MPPRPSAARTPLFAAVRRAWRVAAASRQPGAPPVDELVARAQEIHRERRLHTLDRRQFLKLTGAAAAGVALAPTLWGCDTGGPAGDARIAIVGGGMAGLNAAYQLGKVGVRATVYEAADRTGGRMFTARDLVATGATTELGGEFIDTGHEDMLALVAELGLDLRDRQAPDNEPFLPAYFFDGRHYTEEEVIAAFVPLAARIQADYDSTGEIVDFENEGNATTLDNTSLADYLVQIGATGFIRELLEVAYVTEYGLDAGEQSALNFILLVGTDVTEGFAIFGESDERYRVVGGNQQVVDGLAARLPGQIELGHRLEAVRSRGDGYRLSFASAGGAVEVDADVVLLTLPFTLLREVDLAVPLPAFKTRAINELGYGTNAKLFVGTDGRPWRDAGYNGECFTDEAFQLCWDHTEQQPTAEGGLTLYSGGAAGLTVGEGTPESQVARLLPGVEAAFPGVMAAQNGRVGRFHWPTHPLTRASYACYRPGQWTTIAGAEFRPVGNLFFAGEHCSYDYQGYMNGAAETGRRAAESIAEVVGAAVRAPAAVEAG